MPHSRPTGAVENAIIGANWPEEPVAAIAARDKYSALKERFLTLSDQTSSDAEQQRELLRGQAGDAHYDALRELATKDYELSKHFASKELVTQQHIDITYGAQAMQVQIAADGRKAYDAAIKAKNPSAANAAVVEHAGQVASITASAVADVQALGVRDALPNFTKNGKAVQASPVDHKTPVAPDKPEFPSLSKGRQNGDARALDHEKNTKQPSPEHGKQTSVDPEKSESKAKDGDAEGKQTDSKSVLGDKAGEGLTKSGDNAAHMKQSDIAGEGVPTQQTFTGMPGSAMSQLPGGGSQSGMGGGSGSGMSGLSGLSSQASSLQSGLSGAKSSMPSGLGGGGGSTPTMPASSSPPASPSSSFGEGMRSASSGFNSGLVSGMAASSPVPTQPPPTQPYAGTPTGATAAAPPAASAAMPASATPSGPPASSGMATPMGGGGFIPPGAMGNGAGSSVAPAPYNVPHGTPPPSAGTSPAAGATGPATPASQNAGGAVGPTGAPLMAAAHTTSTVAPKPVNQDLQLAEHIVQLLVRSDLSSPVEWAVSVIRTAAGAQVLVASNVAGGSYIPRHIFLPTPVKLAAYDPALPIGWFKKWFGWGNPMDILSDHYQRTLIAVRGARATAMATSRPLSRPADPNVPWTFVNRNELPPGPGTRPDGAHQHRLTAHDPALAAQIRNLNPQQQFQLAVAVTKSVITMTVGPDALPTADKTDTDMLDKVSAGTATNADWTAYKALVRDADLEPALHAPQSDDDSENTRRERVQYESTFMRARVKEMISYWETMPPNVHEVAYNALAVKHNVAGTLAALQASLVAAS